MCRGFNVMKGYYNMPEKTAETIEPDGWLHSGDLATIWGGIPTYNQWKNPEIQVRRLRSQTIGWMMWKRRIVSSLFILFF